MKFYKNVLVCALLPVLVCAVPDAVFASNALNVPGTYATIAAAISAASPGDTIIIAAGTYAEQLVVEKDLTIIGSGIDKTILREAPSNPDSTTLFIDHATVSVRDLQVYGGAEWAGGRRGIIAWDAATTLRNCAFVQCYNVSVAAINGSIDIDTLLITCVSSGGGAPTIDSTGTAASPADLGVMIVNSIFQIGHLTGGAAIDHVVNIAPDFSTSPGFIGRNYPIDLGQSTQGTIELSTLFGSRDADYGEGIRIFGNISQPAPQVIIRNNRIRGMVRDSLDAPSNMLTTSGIAFNGYSGYGEIYGNTIQHFNCGISLYGIASAKVHDNTISDNGRYGVVTSWTGGAVQSDLGGGIYGSPGNNRFERNGLYNIYHLNNQPLSAMYNYWGTTDPATIAALIYDHTDNASLGVVTTTGYLLPVELTSFTASVTSPGRVTLSWTTATEVNNAGFEVERKQTDASLLSGLNSGDAALDDGASVWRSIGFVQGHGTTNAPHAYTLIDTPPAGTFLYRLKQTDKDGVFRYSAVQEVQSTVPRLFTLEQNYPNPFNPSTTISFTLETDARTTLTVFDRLGRVVATLVDADLTAGIRYRVAFTPSHIASGVYFYRLHSGNRSLVKSLMLIK